MIKPITFLGDSLDALRAFPESARRQAGYQLDKVQQGLRPDDWKPMTSIGGSVAEIRMRDAAGAFRVVYVARFEEAVYVLHAFQKKSQRTAKADIDLAKARLKELSRRQA